MAEHQNGDSLDMPSKMPSPLNRPLLEAIVRSALVADLHPVTVTLDPTLDCNARCAGCVEGSPMRIAGRHFIEWLRLGGQPPGRGSR